ncbi:MAG: PQQ-binding-like beta-propeller repeat protein [Planctomycetaceae bacterium]|nr:PQQ-binding-like beta-propeller repeat protein [Planctomycetaceae bacterium]
MRRCRQLTNCLLVAGVLLSIFITASRAGAQDHWPQAAGPAGNWQVEGTPPTTWSASRGENILWRAELPEAGMSSPVIWGNRLFVTTHVPIAREEQKNGVEDVLGFCFDALTGEQLWQVELPGEAFISLAGGFTDGTVFAPVTDGRHVWFFNRCGSMCCCTFSGEKVWSRSWTPRFKHNNRQAEPILADGVILYVEVANKEQGAKIQKWSAPGKRSKGTAVPDGVEEQEVWTYIHGIDAATGDVLWREQVGTSIHNTPMAGKLPDGRWAVAHARGGPHGALERPYGQSLTVVSGEAAGQTLWSTQLDRYDPSFSCHWNEDLTMGFQLGEHVVLETSSGKVLRRQPLYSGATAWTWDEQAARWNRQTDFSVKAGKGHPNTNQANLVVGDWHWFLSHNVHYLGRVHARTGRVEYLELPAQLIASEQSRDQDVLLWKKADRGNDPRNAQGFAVGDKGHQGSGWGHISAASPTRVGRYLFFPVVTGTVYVIDSEIDELSPEAIVAINDLGPARETWTLASVTYAGGRLYAHTMTELLCIEP